MGYTYAEYQSALAELMVTSIADPDFVAILPSIIDYAEQRLYRELDVLAATSVQTTPCIAMNRNVSLARLPNFVVTVEDVNVISGGSIAISAPDAGTRNQLRPVSKEYLNAVWNSKASPGVPDLFAMVDNQNLILGPWPDRAYNIEIIGKIRPAPLYNTPGGTYLSLQLPDLFMAGSMIFASGYQKNFGSQADNPQMAVSWETQYEKLFNSANMEEIRKKFHGWGEASSEQTPAPA